MSHILTRIQNTENILLTALLQLFDMLLENVIVASDNISYLGNNKKRTKTSGVLRLVE